MTATAAPTVKDQELVSFGLVESASVNSFADFIPSKLNQSQVTTEHENDDFKHFLKVPLSEYYLYLV